MVEWISFNSIAMIVSIATLVVTCLSYRYNRQCEKRRKKEIIARKQAKLKAIDFASRHGDFTIVQNYMVQKAALEAEIEELKQSEKYD
jgi:ABC-type transport system involved in cytochrome bd biosynthesis fused ATPase/permease subunit